MSSCLESVKFIDGKLTVIDQLKLPGELVYIDISNQQDAWNAIRSMQVRGAPLIAIVAALGLSVDIVANKHKFVDVATAISYTLSSTQYLRTSRPTAAPLFLIMDKLDQLVSTLALDNTITTDSLLSKVVSFSTLLLQEDIDSNKRISNTGANYILNLVKRKKLRVLTICNTGSLATAGYGTALGVIRRLHELNALEHVYACETRPYNQGARLTSFEIVHDKLPGTLIPDSAASALMAVKGVDVVIVGGDRVTVNGDLANKIGTYQLAITAHYHGVPLISAVTSSVVDVTMSSGSCIHIEERPASELTKIANIQIAAEGINVWNPGFDVTPSSLIHAHITELGAVDHSNYPVADDARMLDMYKFLQDVQVIPSATTTTTATEGTTNEAKNTIVVIPHAKPVKSPLSYKRLDEAQIVDYVVHNEQLSELVGIDYYGNKEDNSKLLSIREVGDGNLNFVYIIKGPSGLNKNTIVIKQALPYVRCVGEQWPLTLDRATFEAKALVIHYQLCPEYVPEVYLFDEFKALIAMRFIETPHLILRKVLMNEELSLYTAFPVHVATFMARTLYGTSSLKLSALELRANISWWSKNSSMCALTEQVIFTDPYYAAPYNHFERISPELESAITQGIYTDVELKVHINQLKYKFVTNTQALLHGDLHTGSIMVTPTSTFIIDPEFAYYGPIGFDTGLFIANMLLGYCSHIHSTTTAELILQLLKQFYESFEKSFIDCWNSDRTDGTVTKGDISHPKVFVTTQEIQTVQRSFMNEVWRDSLGFAGAEMIRRVVGIAHVADLEHQVDTVCTVNTRNADMNNHTSVVLSSYLALAIGRTLVINTEDRSEKALLSMDNVLAYITSTTQYVLTLTPITTPLAWPLVK